MVLSIWNFIINTFSALGDFANWLFIPIDHLGIAPISLFGITGFSIVFALHVAHLINVIGG